MLSRHFKYFNEIIPPFSIRTFIVETDVPVEIEIYPKKENLGRKKDRLRWSLGYGDQCYSTSKVFYSYW